MTSKSPKTNELKSKRKKAFNLTIPSRLHKDWESTTGPDGDRPIKSTNSKYKRYQYGVRSALEQASVGKKDFMKIFTWLVSEDSAVDVKRWMRDLRQAGLGSCSRGKNKENIAKMKRVIDKWMCLYNKHHKDQIISCKPS